MGTTWVEDDFESDFEACKDDAFIEMLKTHGQWVTFKFQDQGKNDERIFGYFDKEHEDLSIDGDVAFSSRETMFECRYSDFENVPRQDDLFTVVQKQGDGAWYITGNYRILDRGPVDEQGAVRFILEYIDGSRSQTNP